MGTKGLLEIIKGSKGSSKTWDQRAPTIKGTHTTATTSATATATIAATTLATTTASTATATAATSATATSIISTVPGRPPPPRSRSPLRPAGRDAKRPLCQRRRIWLGRRRPTEAQRARPRPPLDMGGVAALFGCVLTLASMALLAYCVQQETPNERAHARCWQTICPMPSSNPQVVAVGVGEHLAEHRLELDLVGPDAVEVAVIALQWPRGSTHCRTRPTGRWLEGGRADPAAERWGSNGFATLPTACTNPSFPSPTYPPSICKTDLRYKSAPIHLPTCLATRLPRPTCRANCSHATGWAGVSTCPNWQQRRRWRRGSRIHTQHTKTLLRPS